MVSLKPLVAELNASLNERLRHEGLRQINRQNLIWPIDDESFGRIIFSATVSYGRVVVDLIIGIQSLPIERLVAEVKGRRMPKPVPNTVQENLSNIFAAVHGLPLGWEVRQGQAPGPHTARIVEAFQELGRPWAIAHSSLEAIGALLLHGFPPRSGNLRQFERLLCLYALRGDYSAAISALDEGIKPFDSRLNSAIEARAFADAFRSRFGVERDED